MVGTVVILVVLAALLAAGAVWLVRVLRAELTGLRTESAEQLAGRNAEIDGRLAGITETMDRRFGELDTKVDRRLGEMDVKVDRRLAGMTETSARMHEGLGKVGGVGDSILLQTGFHGHDAMRREAGTAPSVG